MGSEIDPLGVAGLRQPPYLRRGIYWVLENGEYRLKRDLPPARQLWSIRQEEVGATVGRVDLRRGAPDYLFWQHGSDGGLRGHLLTRLDGGSPDRSGAPHVWTETTPWGAIINVDATVHPWLDRLARGDESAWFTMSGNDTWEIFEPPVPAENGFLLFRLYRRLA